MSSILKALKKLEDDKATRRPDELRIDAEILRSESSPRFSTSSVLLASLLLLAAGSGATYVYMKKNKTLEYVQPKSSLISKQNISPVSAASEIKTERLPATVVVVPSTTQQKVVNAETAKPHRPPLPSVKAPANTVPKQAVALKPAEPTKNSIAPSPSPKATSGVTIPALRVNGIAFQDGGADSVAMINNVALTSGSMIDGVKIEEILKNKVRFNYNGEKFEIPLGQSNR